MRPAADSDQRTLYEFCRDNQIPAHHKHSVENLWKRINERLPPEPTAPLPLAIAVPKVDEYQRKLAWRVVNKMRRDKKGQHMKLKAYIDHLEQLLREADNGGPAD